ncbi:MAG: cardiolipin synthase [Pseudomonadota bacterium]
MIQQLSHFTFTLHVLVAIAVSARVISQRPPVGVALAWILVTVLAPFVGAALYLIIGERRMSRGQGHRLVVERESFRDLCNAMVADGLSAVDWSRHPGKAREMDTLGDRTVGSHIVHGSEIELLSETDAIFKRLRDDIDAARKSLILEFFIWSPGGRADDILDAVIRAAERGVSCRVLIDAIGASPWWRSGQPKRLRDAGVYLRRALPVRLSRIVFGRTDLRLHRKIVIIDHRIAWTGSMNLADPEYFKQDAGVGEWVDAMSRIEGAAVAPLAAIAIGDWTVETGEDSRAVLRQSDLQHVTPTGDTDMQVIPSGPGESGDALLHMMLAAITAAHDRLVITTPYLIPYDALLWALRGAAARGVKVQIILPEVVDSVLTRYASRSYYEDLMQAGVEIHLFRGGLLHTKSMTVDDHLSMFGTVNFDLRSLWLNYEVALFVYDADFTGRLLALQESYMADAQEVDRKAWNARPHSTRFLEDTARLTSPLL